MHDTNDPASPAVGGKCRLIKLVMMPAAACRLVRCCVTQLLRHDMPRGFLNPHEGFGFLQHMLSL